MIVIWILFALALLIVIALIVHLLLEVRETAKEIKKTSEAFPPFFQEAQELGAMMGPLSQRIKAAGESVQNGIVEGRALALQIQSTTTIVKQAFEVGGTIYEAKQLAPQVVNLLQKKKSRSMPAFFQRLIKPILRRFRSKKARARR